MLTREMAITYKYRRRVYLLVLKVRLQKMPNNNQMHSILKVY